MKIFAKNITSKLVLSFLLVFIISTSVFAGGKKDKGAQKTSDFSNSEIEAETAGSTDTNADLSLESENTSQYSGQKESAEQLSGKDKNSIYVASLNGVMTIPCAYLLDNRTVLEKYPVNLTVENEQILIEKIVSDDVDIAFVPVDIAAKIYNVYGRKIKVFAVCCNGNFSVLSYNNEIISFENLKGKTVNITEKDSIADNIFQYILKSNGIPSGDDENSVNIEYSVANANVAQAMLSGKTDYVLAGEPYLTTVIKKDSSVQKVLDLQDEYTIFAEKSKEKFPFYVAVVNSEFALNNQEKLSLFSDLLKKSIEWTVNNPQKAGVSYQKNQLGFMAPIIGSAIGNCNFVYENASDSSPRIIELLKIILEYNPESIGGNLPDDEFFY